MAQKSLNIALEILLGTFFGSSSIWHYLVDNYL